MEFVSVDNLQPGFLVAQNIYDYNSRLLISRGNRLTKELIAKLRYWGVFGVYVDSAPSRGIVTYAPISDVLHNDALRALAAVDIDKIETNAIALVHELSSSLLDADMRMISMYDITTAQHSLNVAIYSVVVAKALGYSEARVEQIAQAGMLHDIGKLLVPKDIITKPGRLTDEERDIIKMHVDYGYEWLKGRYDMLSVVRMGVYEHHEMEDGTGYPRGIKGDKIHSFAKIIHVADVYDALVAKRSYKESWSAKEAMEYLSKNSGTQFDAQVVKAFRHVVPVYRKGSSVQLSDDRNAIVVCNHVDDLARPVIRVRDTGEEINLKDSDLEIVHVD